MSLTPNNCLYVRWRAPDGSLLSLVMDNEGGVTWCAMGPRVVPFSGERAVANGEFHVQMEINRLKALDDEPDEQCTSQVTSEEKT